MTKRSRITVNQEAGTGEWIVTEYVRHGWNVLFRGSKEDALDYAQDLAFDRAEARAGR
jgi:hypothetical protein